MKTRMLLLTLVTVLTGCQTASAYIGAAQGARHHAAKIEATANRKALCSSNFDVIREMFGSNDQDWNAILNVCESGLPSVKREPD